MKSHEKIQLKKWQKLAEDCPVRAIGFYPTRLFICGLIEQKIGKRECAQENCLPWHWRNK